MAEGEDGEVARDLLAGRKDESPKPAGLALPQDVRDLRPEPEGGPAIEKMPTHAPEDDDEPVRPDVGPGVEEDRVGGAEAVERLEDDGDLVVPLAAGQLSVAEGPRAPLAELDVRLGVERAARPETHDLPVALLGGIAPLEESHRGAGVDEGEGGEEPRGARADDDDARLAVETGEEKLRTPWRRGLFQLQRRGKGGRGRNAEIELDGAFVEEVGLLAGIERPADEGEAGDLRGVDVEEPRDTRRVGKLRGPGPDPRKPVPWHGGYSRDAMGDGGPRETEVKFRLSSRLPFEARLDALGARCEGEERERNVLFDDDAGTLQARGCALRLRTTENGALLTFKGKAEFSKGVKSRLELESGVDEPDRIEALLAELGYAPRFVYEKRRTTWRFPDAARPFVVVDETPLGLFAEVEGTHEAVRALAAELGVAEGAFIPESYAALWMKAREADPGLPHDMVFPT